MAKVIAIANQKGGVGKTTTAVNLSSCVAALGKRVLIVDLDPQGNTTTGYGIPKRSVEKGTYEILIGEARASEAIRKTEYRTDVIGSNTRLAGASLEMIDLPARESRLRKALAEVQKDYDFIFIDCPPSLDLLTPVSYTHLYRERVRCLWLRRHRSGQCLPRVRRHRGRPRPQEHPQHDDQQLSLIHI